MIYFIQAGKDGPIKIGIAENISQRLDTLQNAHYETLHLIGLRDGGRKEEIEIHRTLDSFRLRGEWFRPSPEVLKLVGDITQPPQVPKGYLTTSQVASIMRISARTVSRWIERGEIKPTFDEGRCLIHRSEIEKYGIELIPSI